MAENRQYFVSDALQEDFYAIWESFERLNLVESRLLITGATGLIGSILVKAAAAYNDSHSGKIHVLAFARSQEKAKAIFGELNDIEFFYQDICKPLPDITCDYIIHTANSTGSKFFMSNPVEVLDSIYTGSKNILDFALRSRVKGVVYLSSMEVFGQVYETRRVSEQELGYIDLQNVRSCYPEGKRIVECMCKAYAEEYGLPVKVARLAQTFGAGVQPTENRVFAQFARSAIRGENIVLHTLGDSIGNYVYTRDAIKGILMLLRLGENGEAYTIVNEESTMTIRQMAELVLNEFGFKEAKVIFDIPKTNEYGYAPPTKLSLSAAKMKALGWAPEISIVEAYRRMIPYL